MFLSKRKPNSKGSFANAYKLSSITLKVEAKSRIGEVLQIFVGCEDDDQYYTPEDEGRLIASIEIETENEKGEQIIEQCNWIEFDLEDFLKECKKLTPHLFK